MRAEQISERDRSIPEVGGKLNCLLIHVQRFWIAQATKSYGEASCVRSGSIGSVTDLRGQAL